MKKLIKFKPSAKTYLDIAEYKYDCGDLSAAVHYFFKAYDRHGGINPLIALGEVYCEMDEPEEGLRYLYRALDKCPGDTEICHSIAQCYLDMDDEETAFFYFQPRMSIKRFKYILEESEREESKYVPIRVLEKNDDMVVGIALKLLSGGDAAYARELLLTVKPQSEHYVAACNLLSVSALDLENPDEAIMYAKLALECGECVDSRCNIMLAYHMQGDTELAQQMMEKIEERRLTLDERKTVSLAYIRMDEAEKALSHLRVLHGSERYNRDTLVSYALACYRMGDDDTAKQLMVDAARAYPADIAIRELSAAMARGDELPLYPMLVGDTATTWLLEIDNKLELSAKEGIDLVDDESFCTKIEWLFQSRLPSRQSSAAMILCRFPSWERFFRQQLLENSLDLATKKVCLYSLLQSGAEGIGLVVDGLYARLKVKYPSPMDSVFRTAYCMAFSSFALSDSCFEDRLFTAGKKLLPKYLLASVEGVVFDSDLLAAALFHVARHKRISGTIACAHLFDCDHQRLKDCLQALGVK